MAVRRAPTGHTTTHKGTMRSEHRSNHQMQRTPSEPLANTSPPPSLLRAVAKFRRRQGDGVQLVQHSAEHKGATRNAPWHGLGLEARGTEAGRQAAKEPKERATLRREKKEEQKKQKARWKGESHTINGAQLGRRRSSSHRDSQWGAAAPSDKATRHNDAV